MSLVSTQPLAFGAATVGNLYREVSDERAWETLQAAWDAGIRHFDTAPHYGIGLSERRLGAFLRTKPRDEFILSTKVGRLLDPADRIEGDDMAFEFAAPRTHVRRVDNSAAGIRRSLEDSLERLGLDRVDILYLHDPEEAPEGLQLALEQGLPALAALRQEGTANAIGVGSKDVAALTAAAKSGLADTLMVSGRFTLLEQPAAEELLPVMEERGVAGVAVSIFNSGLLAKPRPASDARYEYAAAAGELVERANRIADVCEAHGIDLPTAALAFPLLHPAIEARVVSASSRQQMEQTAQRASTPVPDGVWSDLASAGLLDAALVP